MIRGVQPHIARTLRSVEALDDAIMVRRILMDHGERAIRIRGERIAVEGVEPGAVDTLADRNRGHHLARLIIGYRHDPAAASTEEPAVGRIDGHGDRLPAGSRRP